jgi:hypothetical protein
MADTSSESNNRFKTIIAILIALVTVTGAIVAWRAAVAGGDAGDADLAGIAATLNTEETRTLNKANLYANYQAYANYVRYNELGNLIATDLENASSDEAAQLEQQKAEAWDVATTNQGFFPNRYLDEQGNYDIQRELGEAWAEAQQIKDLNPEPHFAEADHLRSKANWLVGAIIILSIALLFYTLAEGMSSMLKYVLALGGTVSLLAGITITLIVELVM